MENKRISERASNRPRRRRRLENTMEQAWKWIPLDE